MRPYENTIESKLMNNQVKYFYVRTPDHNTEKFGHRGTPIACVAYVASNCRDYVSDSPVTRVQYALSTVSTSPDEDGFVDQFNKQTGRELAHDRLVNGSSDENETLFTDSVKSSDITADIMFALYSDGLTPSRVKKAAKRWLWPSNNRFNGSIVTLRCDNACGTIEDIVVSRDVEWYMTLWQSFKHWVKSVFS